MPARKHPLFDETVLESPKKMAKMGVGALPIGGNDNRLQGMITDQDIVVKVLAQGRTRPRPAPVNWGRASP